MMNNSPSKLQAWRSRRKLRSLKQWEKIRTKGKARYVIQSAVTWGLSMVGLMDVYEHLFGSGQSSISLIWIIGYVGMGFIGAFSGWDTMEGKYQNALIDARVNAAPSGATHNSPLQITVDSNSK
jgi:hypothetical protein